MSQMTGFNAGGEHDPYWNSVLILVPFKTSPHVDLKGNTIVGTTTGASGGQFCWSVFDGHTGVSIPSSALGTSDFTIETFFTIANTTASGFLAMGLVDSMPDTTPIYGVTVYDNNTSVSLSANGHGTPTYLYGQSFGGPYHVAITRTSGVIRWYFNGSKFAEYTPPSPYNFTNILVQLGGMANGSDSIGCVSAFRMTSVSRYSGETLQIPTLPFPDQK